MYLDNISQTWEDILKDCKVKFVYYWSYLFFIFLWENILKAQKPDHGSLNFHTHMSVPLLTHLKQAALKLIKRFSLYSPKLIEITRGVSSLFSNSPTPKTQNKNEFLYIFKYFNKWLLSINIVNNIEADCDTTSEKLCFI